MARTIDRTGNWRRRGLMLAVVWAIAVILYGWGTLPQPSHVPPTLQLLNKLPNEAVAIMFARDAHAVPARGALVWTQANMVVRMPNGAALTFPATTRGELVAFVRNEYSRLLDAETNKRRWRHMLNMVVIALLPFALLLAAAVATRGRKLVPYSVRQPTERSLA